MDRDVRSCSAVCSGTTGLLRADNRGWCTCPATCRPANPLCLFLEHSAREKLTRQHPALSCPLELALTWMPLGCSEAPARPAGSVQTPQERSTGWTPGPAQLVVTAAFTPGDCGPGRRPSTHRGTRTTATTPRSRRPVSDPSHLTPWGLHTVCVTCGSDLTPHSAWGGPQEKTLWGVLG